jgi:hypothetical protein
MAARASNERGGHQNVQGRSEHHHRRGAAGSRRGDVCDARPLAHSIVVINRSGQPANDVSLAVSDLSGQAIGTAMAANLAEGQSLAAGHDLKTVQMSLTFTLAGKSHEYSNPYLDFSSGTRWTFEIQPEGAIKLSAAGP